MREEVLYVIFLDLTKAYDDLDRSRSLEILKGYWVGERVRRLLTVYWERTTMVERAGSYYGKGFKGGIVLAYYGIRSIGFRSTVVPSLVGGGG